MQGLALQRKNNMQWMSTGSQPATAMRKLLAMLPEADPAPASCTSSCKLLNKPKTNSLRSSSGKECLRPNVETLANLSVL